MKVAIGLRLQDGPFGGANQFGKSIALFLNHRGIEVVFDLVDTDIDIIVLIAPQHSRRFISFGPVEIMDYLQRKNSKAMVVHRINECDERKGTHTMNKQLALANSIADHSVYVGSWLVDLFRNQGLTFTSSYQVILNGGDSTIFQFKQKTVPPSQKVKLVTHHWAANWMKGWDVYMFIDSLLGLPEHRENLELHVIGNVPKECQPTHLVVHAPRTGKDLAQLLSTFDVYLTASIHEPGANHPTEGALCGLPLLYRNSGSLPEYCKGYGEMFTGVHDILPALERLLSAYPSYASRMASYHHTSERMCEEYLQLFTSLLSHRDQILQKRPVGAYGSKKRIRMKLALAFYRIISKLERLNLYGKNVRQV